MIVSNRACTGACHITLTLMHANIQYQVRIINFVYTIIKVRNEGRFIIVSRDSISTTMIETWQGLYYARSICRVIIK